MRLRIIFDLLITISKNMPCRLLIIVVLILSPLKLYCNSGPFYVATNGSNSSNGTFINPFRTIQRAVNLMSAGPSNCTVATTYIFPGTYSEQILISSNYNSNYMVITALSNDNAPTLNGLYSSNYAIQILNAGFIEISHLNIKHYTNGIVLKNNATNNRIINNIIYSNDNNGISISGSRIFGNYIKYNTICGKNQEIGICITNGYTNTIELNIIYQNKKGIYLKSNASNNYIRKNEIYSNNICGIEINSDNNYISENKIQGTNQDIGIYILQGKKNTIELNTIYDHNLYGIVLKNSISNNIVRNTLYSHNIANIFLTNCSYDRISKNNLSKTTNNGIYVQNGNNNIIASNAIYDHSTNGIFIANGNNNIILSNRIYDNYYGIQIKDGTNNIISINRIDNNANGILLQGNAVDSYVSRNDIYQNQIYGIGIVSEGADNNSIISNTIWGKDQDMGIYITNGNSNKIYRNLVRNNQNYNIYIGGNATNIEIINNTIFKSMNKDGVFWTNSSSGRMYNNIILSNGNNNNDYGIRRASTNQVIVAYNNLYGNKGGPTNGNIDWGNGNRLADPMIDTDTVSTFEILRNIGAAVDGGTNIPKVTANYQKGAPDMGWKESDLVYTSAPPTPELVEARAINCCEIVLRWKDLPNEVSYTLFRNNIPNTNTATPIEEFPYDITRYLDAAVNAEQNYYYWIKAYNIFGPSPFSNMLEVLTPSIYYPVTFAVFPTVFNPEIHGTAKIFFNEYKPEVSVTIYDTAGNIIRTWPKVSGTKSIEWNGKGEQDENEIELSAGIYVIHVKGKNINEMIRMVLMH